MMVTVNIQEAKTNLSKLLERVINGEQIIISKEGKPVAMLSPLIEPPLRRIPGNDTGQVIISSDFDAPLPEFD